jgi:hypothetical protein
LIGGVIGAVAGGFKGHNAGKKIQNACDKMKINPSDPVPATDEFLKEVQKNWFPDPALLSLQKTKSS